MHMSLDYTVSLTHTHNIVIFSSPQSTTAKIVPTIAPHSIPDQGK